MLLIKVVKTISIIGAIMFNIVATIIYIVFTKKGFEVKKVLMFWCSEVLMSWNSDVRADWIVTS